MSWSRGGNTSGPIDARPRLSSLSHENALAWACGLPPPAGTRGSVPDRPVRMRGRSNGMLPLGTAALYVWSMHKAGAQYVRDSRPRFIYYHDAICLDSTMRKWSSSLLQSPLFLGLALGQPRRRRRSFSFCHSLASIPSPLPLPRPRSPPSLTRVCLFCISLTLSRWH